jgi:hypothetical protein
MLHIVRGTRALTARVRLGGLVPGQTLRQLERGIKEALELSRRLRRRCDPGLFCVDCMDELIDELRAQSVMVNGFFDKPARASRKTG